MSNIVLINIILYKEFIPTALCGARGLIQIYNSTRYSICFVCFTRIYESVVGAFSYLYL